MPPPATMLHYAEMSFAAWRHFAGSAAASLCAATSPRRATRPIITHFIGSRHGRVRQTARRMHFTGRRRHVSRSAFRQEARESARRSAASRAILTLLPPPHIFQAEHCHDSEFSGCARCCAPLAKRRRRKAAPGLRCHAAIEDAPHCRAAGSAIASRQRRLMLAD